MEDSSDSYATPGSAVSSLLRLDGFRVGLFAEYNRGHEVSGESDGLDDDFRDHLVAAGRAIVGLVPFAGGALGEILTAVIPGQRADRIVEYLRLLSTQMERLESSVQQGIVNNPAKVALIEDGGYQAARALSAARINQVVDVVVSGLTSEETETVRHGRLLSLLGELDDDEVILLNAYGQSYGGDGSVWETIDRPGPAIFGSSRRELDQTYLYEAGKDHLMRLGLLQKKFPLLKKGQIPEFDKSKGDFKHSIEVSGLGRLLLREIGKPTPFDQ